MSSNTSYHVTDNHGRPINYLRLAVTDRCNLRCFYCMPSQGLDWLPRSELLTYEEMLRMTTLLSEMGVNKVRITGGEPFVRKDLMYFLTKLTKIHGLKSVHITTNGVLTWKYLEQLRDIGINSLNLSLDTIDPDRFKKITRRDEFDNVMKTFHGALDLGFSLKINCVVIDGQNTQDIAPLAELARNHRVNVRFIEEMPFNGDGHDISAIIWNNRRIIEEIRKEFPRLTRKTDPPNSTAALYDIPGFTGDIGVIAAYTRTFCGSCDRIRVTAQGMLKTCLYDEGVLSIRDILRRTDDDKEVQEELLKAFKNRAKDGFEAEASRSLNHPATESMSTIGG